MSRQISYCLLDMLRKLRIRKTRYFFQANTKVKLLVRSHAMRESTSPPREPQNGSSSPHSPQSVDSEKKFTGNLSPSSTNSKLNNNESMFNSNLCSNQSPKQMRNTATSPTYRAPSRNGNVSFVKSCYCY